MNIETFGQKFDLLADKLIEGFYAIYAPGNFIAANMIPLGLKRIEKEAQETLDAVKKFFSGLQKEYQALLSETKDLQDAEIRLRIDQKKATIFKDLEIISERMRFFASQQLSTLGEYDASLRNKSIEESLERLSKITADQIFEAWIEGTDLF